MQGTFQGLLQNLKPVAKPKGTPLERIVHYTLQALVMRRDGGGFKHFLAPSKRPLHVSALLPSYLALSPTF